MWEVCRAAGWLVQEQRWELSSVWGQTPCPPPSHARGLVYELFSPVLCSMCLPDALGLAQAPSLPLTNPEAIAGISDLVGPKWCPFSIQPPEVIQLMPFSYLNPSNDVPAQKKPASPDPHGPVQPAPLSLCSLRPQLPANTLSVWW